MHYHESNFLKEFHVFFIYGKKFSFLYMENKLFIVYS